MEIINEIFTKSKIILYADKEKNIYKVIIENYDQIMDFDNNMIRFTSYIISGTNLKISKMEDNELEIKGKIKSFSIEKV